MIGVVDLLALTRSGERDAAFHGLVELDDDALPALEEAFGREPDPVVRSLLVEAIWQHRRPASIRVLAEALDDPVAEILPPR